MTWRSSAMRLIVAAALIYLTVRSAEFLLQDGYPSGYYYDLGVHVMATSFQSTTIRSPQDLLDCFGWAAWGDAPQFAFNPMTTSVVLVAFVKSGASVQLAVKLLVVAQFWIALGSMALLYRTFRRSWIWSIAAGSLYAFFPATSLQISSNLDLGFSVALAPLALAGAVALLRRFGVSALPLAGAVCGFAGLGFAPEYYLIVSLPLLLLVIVTAYSGKERLSWFLGSLAGLACSVGIGLYCILPTLASGAVFTSPSTRISESTNGAYLEYFSESLAAITHGISTESILSPSAEFNVTRLLWTTSIALAIVWLAALTYAVRSIKHKSRAAPYLVALAIPLLLSFGPQLPFVATVWEAIRNIPVLQFLRTPDRFTVVPFVALVLCATMLFETLNRQRLRRLRVGVPFSVAVIGISLAYFDINAGSLVVRPTLDYRLPNLSEINAAARRQPSPLATYTFVNDGQYLDTALYGAGVPTRIVAQDLLSRYGSSPAHALGMLQKAGIQTVVTTPLWASDVAGWPDLGALYAGSKWTKRVTSQTLGAAVWHLERAVPAISAVRTGCFHGGAGLLDEIALLERMQAITLVARDDRCDVDVYADADPRDESRSWLKTWSGASLMRVLPVHDYDYSITTTRQLLARPWYRDTILGDATSFNGVASIPDRWKERLDLTVSRPGRYEIDARESAAAAVCISARVDGARAGFEQCRPGVAGLHWLSVELPLSAGSHRIAVSLYSKTSSQSALPILLDGIGVAPFPTGHASPPRPRIVIYALRWMRNASAGIPVYLPSGRYLASWFAADGKRIATARLAPKAAAETALVVDRTGYVRFRPAPLKADLLALFPAGANLNAPRQPAVGNISAATWLVGKANSSVVRATVLNDRAWAMDGGGRHFEGFDCDVVDTCFGSLPVGHYVLHHRWPKAIQLGATLSIVTWLGAILFCILGSKRNRRRAKAP